MISHDTDAGDPAATGPPTLHAADDRVPTRDQAGAADFEPVREDPWHPDLALAGSGLLARANSAGLISAGDLHVAVTIGRLAQEDDETVLLAIALTVRAARRGSVALDLNELWRSEPLTAYVPDAAGWQQTVKASRVAAPGGPLRWDADLLYLDRYWRLEERLALDLLSRLRQEPPLFDDAAMEAALGFAFYGGDDDTQQNAAELVLRNWVSVITGGPGTGKTYTVAKVLDCLKALDGSNARIALAAPTGKAAAQMTEAVNRAGSLGKPDSEPAEALVATTVHRLLGAKQENRHRFLHNRANPLPFDLIVIDETSMLSMTLLARLVEAVRPNARIVFLGDPDQLASVEAGAVMADLASGLTERYASAKEPARKQPSVARLTHTWRYGQSLATLATAIRDGNADRVLEVLADGDAETALSAHFDPAGQGDLLAALLEQRQAAEDGDAANALALLSRHRVLCGHRTGAYGVEHWNRRTEQWVAQAWVLHGHGTGYFDPATTPGRPLVATENDYSRGLFNGDTGVIVRNTDGEVRAVFPRRPDDHTGLGSAADYAAFSPRQLTTVETAYATTVHRSQGSQFDQVTVILPPEDSPLLTRELLYTAVTRAKNRVRVVGTAAQIRSAVERQAHRASGLRRKLARE